MIVSDLDVVEICNDKWKTYQFFKNNGFNTVHTYIKLEEAQVEKFKKLESKKLPTDIDYSELKGLRIEARQKLNKAKPTSVGQASRISGVSPADISVLLIYLEQLKKK